MKESRQEHQRKGKVNQSINGKQKDKCTKGDACSSLHDENNVEHRSTHPLLPQNRRRKKSDGENSSKGKVSQRTVSVWKRNRRPCKDNNSGNARTRPVILGILPCVRITKQNRSANSVKRSLLCTKRLTVKQTTKFQDIETPQSNSISRRAVRSCLRGEAFFRINFFCWVLEVWPVHSEEIEFRCHTLEQLQLSSNEKIIFFSELFQKIGPFCSSTQFNDLACFGLTPRRSVSGVATTLGIGQSQSLQGARDILLVLVRTRFTIVAMSVFYPKS